MAKTSMRILILSAFPEEMSNFIKRFSNLETIQLNSVRVQYCQYYESQIYFAFTGMGTVCAGVLMGLMKQAIDPDIVIFMGTAGGIANHLKIGDVIIARIAVDVDIFYLHSRVKGTPFEQALLNPINQKSTPEVYSAGRILDLMHGLNLERDYYLGTVATSNYFPAPEAAFKIIKQLGVLSIDMESSAIYQAGWLLNMDTIVIRSISNMLDEHGTDDQIEAAPIDQCAENLAKCAITVLDHLLSITTTQLQ